MTQYVVVVVVVTFSLGQSPQNRRRDGRDDEEEKSLEKTRGPVRTTRRVAAAAALRVCDFDVSRRGSFKGDDVLFGDLRWCDTLRAALFFFVLCLRRVRIVSSADPN